MPAPALLTLLTLLVGCGGRSDDSAPPGPDQVAPEAPAGSGLLPDVGGSPRLVALALNSARRALLRNAELVDHVIDGLPAQTRFVVLTNDLAAFEVVQGDGAGRVEFVELSADSPITIWTQDPFLVIEEAGDTVLLTSRSFERADDRRMADAIARATGFTVRRSELFFEGGNVVSDRETVFVGANTIRYNAAELDLPELEVVLRFERELGRAVVVVGPFPQPIGHIDMMLTPLGDGRLALADPGAGARLAEAELEARPDSVLAFERWCEEHFFGHPAIDEVPAGEGEFHRPPAVVDETASIIEQSRGLEPVLDRVAEALDAQGYTVERVPWLGPVASFRESSARTEKENRPETEDRENRTEQNDEKESASYPMLTYNNVILETAGSAPVVYLPRYGWPALDEAAEEAWRALGFETRSVEGLTISSMYGGALRCSVKVLAR